MRIVLALAASLLSVAPAAAHFQEILPSADVLPEGGEISLDLVFTHPMEGGPTMDMARPARVGVSMNGTVRDLGEALQEVSIDGKTAWHLTDRLDEPGAASYFVEPQPYWEPAERKWIIHYSKVIVDSYASGEGWDTAVGLPVEIEPLARPTGLWTGNLFRGIVRQDGKPVPFAKIEVEWVNDGSITPPNEAFITQVIRADQDGVFAYALPHSGWWGLAALVDGPARAAPDGSEGATELGGLIWVKATDMTAAQGTPGE
ncbi:DUF4198 domain-containing protein [Consotaella aegiceratis]|uniref:DUF4198 domain-containing protein n=1 Tax=Consotaella aegiceratis TaxID=3097961 RepID=UPI002F41D973